MDIRYYTALPPGLQQPVCQLAACCRAHDNSSLSYPLPPEEGVLRHYLAFGSPQKLVGALAVISWDEDTRAHGMMQIPQTGNCCIYAAGGTEKGLFFQTAGSGSGRF